MTTENGMSSTDDIVYIHKWFLVGNRRVRISIMVSHDLYKDYESGTYETVKAINEMLDEELSRFIKHEGL